MVNAAIAGNAVRLIRMAVGIAAEISTEPNRHKTNSTDPKSAIAYSGKRLPLCNPVRYLCGYTLLGLAATIVFPVAPVVVVIPAAHLTVNLI